MFGSALPGVIVMFSAVLILFLLPWLDKNPIKSIRYKGWITKVMTVVFGVVYIMLNYLGMQPPSGLYTALSQIGTVYYFVYFFSLLFIHKFEQSKPVPERVTA